MAVTATTDIRERREQLGLSRLRLAALSKVSTTRLAELEAGCGRGASVARVEAVLHQLEQEAA